MKQIIQDLKKGRTLLSEIKTSLMLPPGLIMEGLNALQPALVQQLLEQCNKLNTHFIKHYFAK